MDSRIWDDNLKIKTVEKTINAYIEEEILNIKNKEVLEKWNYFSMVDLKDKKTREKLLSVIKYIDELTLTKDKKIEYILTFAYLVLKLKLKISDMDENSIYLLVNYLNDMKISDIKDSLKYLNNDKLLYQIRLKSLDLDYRYKLIKYVDKKRDKYQDIIKYIKETEYYKLLEEIEREL